MRSDITLAADVAVRHALITSAVAISRHRPRSTRHVLAVRPGIHQHITPPPTLDEITALPESRWLTLTEALTDAGLTPDKVVAVCRSYVDETLYTQAAHDPVRLAGLVDRALTAR